VDLDYVSILDFTGANDDEVMNVVVLYDVQSSNQIVATNKPKPAFLQAGCSSYRPTNSVRALKGNTQATTSLVISLKFKIVHLNIIGLLKKNWKENR